VGLHSALKYKAIRRKPFAMEVRQQCKACTTPQLNLMTMPEDIHFLLAPSRKLELWEVQW